MNDSNTTLQTVYVTETYLGCRIPKIEQYQAESIRATGVKVLIRGATKFIPIANGRKFFTDIDKLIDYLKSYISREIKLAECIVKELSTYLNDETNNELLSMIKLVPHNDSPQFKIKLEDL